MSELFESDRRLRIRAIVNECLRCRSHGVSVSHEQLISTHPELLPELAEQLKYLSILTRVPEFASGMEGSGLAVDAHPAPWGAGATSDAARQIETRCPTCHASILVPLDAMDDEISCPACGSDFNLLDDEESDDAPPTLGRSIGRFELIEFLGKGAFGTVWKALDPDLDRIVAIKVPRRGELSAGEAELFLREARAAAQLRHPNIIGVHEVGRDGDLIYLVGDYVDADPLARWAGKQQPSPAEAAALCEQIARSLHYVHEAGIVHRDLKPSNILVGHAGEPYVMDFGLAKRSTGELSLTMDGQILGTPAYMSPEQASGAGNESDARMDVYAMGVILFELLTGEVPFQGAPHRILQQVIHDEPPPPHRLNPDIPQDLSTICLTCLEKHPQQRYASALDLADDLRRHLTHQPIAARRIGALRRVVRWGRRRPATAAGLALLTVLAIVGPLVAAAFTRVAAREEAVRHEVQDAAARTRFAKAIAFVLDEVFPAAPPADLSEVQTSIKGRVQRLQSRLEMGLLAQDSEFEAEVQEVVSYAARIHQLPWPAEWSARQALMRHQGQDDKLATARSMAVLAEALLMRRRWVEAEDYCRQALALRVDQYGHSHREVMQTRDLLARILLDAGKVEDAERQSRRTVEWHRQEQTEPDVDAADCRFTLAQILMRQGKIADAERECRLALISRWIYYSDDHSDVIASIRQLGEIVRLANAPLQVAPRGRPQAHVDDITGNQLLQLADALSQQKELPRQTTQLISKLEQIINLKQALLGEEDREIGESLADLGLAYYHDFNWTQADHYLTQAAQIMERQLGSDHLSLGVIYEVLGNARCGINEVEPSSPSVDWSRAVDAARRSLHVWQSQPQRKCNVLLIADAQRELGRVLTFAGQTAEAEATLRHAIAQLESFADGKHHTLALALSDYAWLLLRLGRDAEALELASRSFQLGSQNPATPSDQRQREQITFAVALGRNQRFAEACTLIEACLDDRNAFETPSVYSQEAASMLARARRALGDTASAEKHERDLKEGED